jgi:hypothetical protein
MLLLAIMARLSAFGGAPGTLTINNREVTHVSS